MERRIAPVCEDAARIRALISAIECCHCKAAGRVDNIISAIACGWTDKGPGKRPPGARDPVEEIWRRAWAALSAWCAGCPAGSLDLDVGGVPASDLMSLAGERTPLKEWQCQRVVDKLRPFVTWPAVLSDRSIRYVEMSEYARRRQRQQGVSRVLRRAPRRAGGDGSDGHTRHGGRRAGDDHPRRGDRPPRAVQLELRRQPRNRPRGHRR